MTDIEKKAREYAERPANVKTWGMHKSALTDAFLAGAAHALSNQWRDAGKEKPEDGELVLISSRYGVEIAVWNEQCNCWDDAEGDDYMYSAEVVDAWLKIPEYKPEGV